VTSPPYDCYSDDTEVLTYNGWKYIKDIKIGEEVLTLNPNTKEVYWEIVINNYKYKYDGKLVHFKNFNVDLMVTPNHNMYVEYRDGSPTRNRSPFAKKEKLNKSFLKKAKDITTSDLLRINYFKWVGNELSKFTLPPVECIYNKQHKKFESIDIDMEPWCKFMGIYLAEGSCRGSKGGTKKSYEISIKQNVGQSSKYIEDILKRLPFKYNVFRDGESKLQFTISNVNLHTYLKQFGNSHEKYIPKEIKELNQNLLEKFMEGYLIGDGTKSLIKRGKIGKFSGVRSVSNKMLDDMLEISVKLGLVARIIKNNYVAFHNRTHSKIGHFKKEVDYSGNVVCLEVKNNNIIFVRRNGKCAFSGNSLRDYKGYKFDYAEAIKALYRVIKPGGMVVWVVGDAVVKGQETGTSFRHALKFQEVGFLLHDTMIYEKNTTSFPARRTGNRYSQMWEYMFVFSKGKPKTSNLICDKENKWAGHTNWGVKTDRQKNGTLKVKKDIKPVPKFSPRGNIWRYVVGGGFGQSDDEAYEHPAGFPEKLVEDHIKTWSVAGDLVFDPMVGSGTTCKVAKSLDRQWVGCDISDEYCELAKKRLK
jgi:site-specific DNA-methyltransferase (adenine-specific)